jgi:hypothetical protein
MGCSTCKSKRKNSNKDKNVTFEKVNGVDNVTPKSNDSNNNKEERIDTKILSGLSEIAPQGIYEVYRFLFCIGSNSFIFGVSYRLYI